MQYERLRLLILTRVQNQIKILLFAHLFSLLNWEFYKEEVFLMYLFLPSFFHSFILPKRLNMALHFLEEEGGGGILFQGRNAVL